jgi:hypothetical protein
LDLHNGHGAILARYWRKTATAFQDQKSW